MLQNNTTPTQNLKPLRVAIIAFATMTTIFTFVILGISSGNATSDLGPMSTFRIIHLVMTIILILLSRVIPAKILSGKINLQSRFPGINPAQLTSETFTLSFYQRYASAAIVQLALIEATVLFGGIVFLLASHAGEVQSDPTYYLHFLPLFYFLATSAKLLPTEQKLNDLQRMYSADV